MKGEVMDNGTTKEQGSQETAPEVATGSVASGSETTSTTATQATVGQGSSTGTATTSGSLSGTAEPTPEEQFPQAKYLKPVHPEILASTAFKEAGLLPPKQYYGYPDLPNEEDYQWVGYRPQDGETFYSFFKKYGIQPVEIRTWNPQTNERSFASYGGQYWMLRIKVTRLPHD